MAKPNNVVTLPVVRVERGQEHHIIMDVWGGERSMDHVARYIRSFDNAIDLARQELRAGFLVNLREDAAWGDYAEFDNRKTRAQ